MLTRARSGSTGCQAHDSSQSQVEKTQAFCPHSLFLKQTRASCPTCGLQKGLHISHTDKHVDGLWRRRQGPREVLREFFGSRRLYVPLVSCTVGKGGSSGLVGQEGKGTRSPPLPCESTEGNRLIHPKVNQWPMTCILWDVSILSRTLHFFNSYIC
jgi:hypothetical protein